MFGDVAVWLVEPRRTTSVVKYSGTLVHPTRRDQVGIIVTAFAHYIYETSNKELVLADIQGSPMAAQGCDTIFLFDLMTHSVAQDSGVGDHGSEGMKMFVAQRSCDYVCTALGLDQLGPASTPNRADSEDSAGSSTG